MHIPALIHREMPDISEFNYTEFDEEFVDIEKFSEASVAVQMEYYLAGRKGAVNRAFLRRSVADRLLIAGRLLPTGYKLKIYDAWRSYDVQKDLFDEYLNTLIKENKNPQKSYNELHKEAQTFVSLPDRSKRFSYVHSSGGAVDLTIIDGYGRELNMGCGFDDFTPLAATAALEETDLTDARNNRRLLCYVMNEAGFTNYPSEWWHYDYGDIFWSALTGNAVKYSSVFSLEEMKF